MTETLIEQGKKNGEVKYIDSSDVVNTTEKNSNGSNKKNGISVNGNGELQNKLQNEDAKKFLFVSFESLSGDLAWQVMREGHEVKACIIDETDIDNDTYTGILNKVKDWKKYIDWADIIVFDDVGFGKEAEELRKNGKIIVGGALYTDRLEEDREFGQNEMKSCGMLVLPHWDFVDFDAAINFIKNNPARYVFKPSGVIASDSKGILFLGAEDDGKDLIEILEQNKSLWAKKIKKFQLQKMATGVEIAVGAFFNGKDFIYPININFEHKKLFPGDIGPYTGEMGTLMYWSEPNVIFKNTLLKIKDKLAESGYVGYIDINCIANAKGVYPLEFTTRFGYPTISIQMEGILSKMSDFLLAMAKGEDFELKTKKGFQLGVVVAVPPFPYDDRNEAFVYKDLSILFRRNNKEGMHIGDVKIVNDVWTVAGDSGYVLVVTGSGFTVEDARRQAYSRIRNINLQNMFYRTDIGEKWFHESDKLHIWGYLY